MDGYISDMQLNPSKMICDKDNKKLFGFIVRQQGPKLIMITQIFDESRRKEIVSNTKIMAAVAEKILKKKGIDRICVVDLKYVKKQLSKYQINHEKLELDEDQKQDVVIEVEDWVRGGFVSVDFTISDEYYENRQS